MVPNHDPILGIHAQALSTWARRNEILATNIANADTPNYKARDLDFRAELARTAEASARLTTTHAGHQRGSASLVGESSLLYRIPHQPALDGNSVESDVEQANFAKNALHYQASLMFIGGKMRSMRAAIAGAHQ